MDFEETVVLRTPEVKVDTERTSLWPFCGTVLPWSVILFGSQTLAIYAVIGFSLYNLTRGDSSDRELWVALLSSSLGYLLSNPKIRQ